MDEFTFVGYTLREKFYPKCFPEYANRCKITDCKEMYSIDEALLPEVPPYNQCYFESYGEFTNRTTFSFEYDNMKKHLDDKNIIIGCFIETCAISAVKWEFQSDGEPLFSYAQVNNIQISPELKHRGYEVVSNRDYKISANTNCDFKKDELQKYGKVTCGLLFENYNSAIKFRDHLNTCNITAHEPFSIWQIWTL